MAYDVFFPRKHPSGFPPMSHGLIRLKPENLTLSGLPIYVARNPAAPFPRAPFSFSLAAMLLRWQLLYGLSGQIAYAINAFYFSHQTPRSDLLWAYIPYCVAIILLIEGIFIPIFRKFTCAA